MIRRRLALLRWDVLAICGLACFIWIVWAVLVPAGRDVFAGLGALRGMRMNDEQIEFVPQRLQAARKHGDILDSLIASAHQHAPFEQSVVLAQLYQLADSAGCHASRVDIGEPVFMAQGSVEYPIQFSGSGSYNAVGRLCEGLESMPQPFRIRNLTLMRSGDDSVAVTIDCIAMDDQKPAVQPAGIGEAGR